MRFHCIWREGGYVVLAEIGQTWSAIFFYLEKEDGSFSIEEDILLKLKLSHILVELKCPILKFVTQQFSHVQYSVC